MRLLFLVVAGAIGWLWYAVRAPAEAPPPPSPHIRQVDLTGLRAQVAAARSAEIAIEMPAEEPEPEGLDEIEELDAIEEDPELADLAEQVQLAIYDQPPPEGAI